MRKNTATILVLVIVLLTGPITAADAVIWGNQIRNGSGGQRGVASDVYVYDRHGSVEYQLIGFESDLPDGRETTIAWEITDWNGLNPPDGKFRLFAHIKWAEGPPDSWGFYGGDAAGNTEVSQYRWHRLKMDDADGDGKPVTWLDGVRWRKFNWPHINWNGSTTYTVTQLEVTQNSEPFWFMGRHKNIWIKDGLGAWKLQDEVWARRIQPFMFPPPPDPNTSPWTN